jgi:hypothetical protein
MRRICMLENKRFCNIACMESENSLLVLYSFCLVWGLAIMSVAGDEPWHSARTADHHLSTEICTLSTQASVSRAASCATTACFFRALVVGGQRLRQVAPILTRDDPVELQGAREWLVNLSTPDSPLCQPGWRLNYPRCLRVKAHATPV